jgi:hypothetical protein
MRSSSVSAVILASALAAVALPAAAQEQTTAEDAMASVIHAALAPSSYGDWRYRWDAVSIRISSLMHWHLPGPDKPGEEAITRRGWISANGQQVSVTAHGIGETVTGLALGYSGWPGYEVERGTLIEALAARGVTVTETSRNEAPEFFHTDEPVILYRLSAEGRHDAALKQTHTCTSPRSAAAQRCDTTYLLDFGGS